MDIDSKYYKAQLETFCGETLIYISNLTMQVMKSCQDKLEHLGVVFQRSLNQQQNDFNIIINDSEYDQILQGFKVQVKSKIDQLQNLQDQINNLDGEVVIERTIYNQFSKQKVDETFLQEIENFNYNRKQMLICFKCLQKCSTKQDLYLHSKQHNLKANNSEYEDSYQEQKKSCYTCSECAMVLKGHRRYRFHCRTWHKIENLFFCGYCSEQYLKACYLAQHCFKEHSRPLHLSKVTVQNQKHIYDCMYTGEEFCQQKVLTKHLINTVEYHHQLPDELGGVRQRLQSQQMNIILDI